MNSLPLLYTPLLLSSSLWDGDVQFSIQPLSHEKFSVVVNAAAVGKKIICDISLTFMDFPPARVNVPDREGEALMVTPPPFSAVQQRISEPEFIVNLHPERISTPPPEEAVQPMMLPPFIMNSLAFCAV